MSESTNGFDYSGQLVFRAFEYRYDKSAEDEFPGVLPYGGGKEELDPEHEESIERETLTNSIQSVITETGTHMPAEFEAYRLIRHRLGSHLEVMEAGSGNVVRGREITSTEGDVALLDTDSVLIRGPQEFANNCVREISTELAQESRLIPIEFEPAFLLWVFSKHYRSSTSPFDRISLIRLNEASFAGEGNRFGESTSLSGANISESIVSLTSVLSGNQLEELGGIFELDGKYIEMNIDSSGRLFVRVAEDLRRKNMAERFVTASRVVNQFVGEYLRWLELPRDEQYPPASFFKQLHDTAEEQGVDISLDVNEMLEQFADRRGESLEEYLNTE